MTRTEHTLVLCVAAVTLTAAERKASITPAQSAVAIPAIGSFESTEGLVVVEGIPGAAHARLAAAGAPVTQSRGLQTLRDVSLPAGAGSVSHFAVSDDGSSIVIAAATGLYQRSGGSWRLLTSASATAVAFAPHSADALMSTTDQLFMVHDGSLRPVASGAIQSPVALLASADGRFAVVLNSGGTDVRVVDLETSAARSYTLGAAARDVIRAAGGVILFVPREGSSPWLLDLTTAELSFAPEIPGAPAESGARLEAR